ncbi:MAG: DUF87 domain-containing protein [Opitutales bacterium]|nr:DUF87 domain-containing protein [Opitutales bacterium]
MIRQIPKKSKVNFTVWKNYGIIDVLLMALFAGIGILIAISNLPSKWIVEIIYIALVLILFRGDDDIKIYEIFQNVLRYLLGAKKYGNGVKKHTRKNSIDLLMPQTGIAEDGVIEYDGLYYAGVLSVSSIEFRLLDEYSQDNKVEQFAAILNRLSTEQQAQIVKIDRPINFDKISDHVNNKIQTCDKEDKVRQVLLESRLAQLDALNNVVKQYRPFYYLVLFDDNKESLQSTLDNVKMSLQQMGLSSEQLGQKDVAVFLKYCYTRNFDEREIDKLSPDKYLEWVKPNSIQFSAFGAKVDDIETVTMAVADYPLNVDNAWGSGLFNIDNTKVVLTIKPTNKDRAIKRIDKVCTEIEARENVTKYSEIIGGGTHIDTMAELLVDLQNGNESLFDCTISVTGFNYGNKDQQAFRKDLRADIARGGFRTTYLGFRQIDGIISSSITRRNRLCRYERGINSKSLAAVFPFIFTSIIDEKGLPLGHNNYPVLLDPWKRDYNHTNSNMTIYGKSGGGKSYFTKTLLSNLHSDNCKLYVLDPENEYDVMVKNYSGNMVDVGSAVTGRLNPFHIYGMLTDNGEPAPSDVVFTNHLRFLESFFKVAIPDLNKDSFEILNNFVLETYKAKGITADTDCSNFKPEQFPIFDDLKKVVENHLTQDTDLNPIQRHNLELVNTYVAKFAGDGRNAKLWNGPSTLTSDSDFEVFNFQSLLEGKNSVVANSQMLLVMRYLEQQIIKIREMNRDVPEDKWLHPCIIIDEGYNFIDPKYPVALDFVYMWYKRIRKYGGMICFITQNLGDIFGNQEIISRTTAIVNNSQYSFVFPLAPADLEILTDLYENAGGINPAERSEIANGQRGHCFLISGARERTSFQVVANDTVSDLFTNVHTKEEIAAMTDVA